MISPATSASLRSVFPAVAFLFALFFARTALAADAFAHHTIALAAASSVPTDGAWVLQATRLVSIGGTSAPRAIATIDLAPSAQWRASTTLLPADFSDPIVATAPNGIIVVDRASGRAALLEFFGESFNVRVLPHFAASLQATNLATSRTTLFAAARARDGSSPSKLFQLLPTSDSVAWTELTTIDPSVGDVQAMAVQNDGVRNLLYVFGRQGFAAFDAERRVWQSLPAIEPRSTLSTLTPVGIAHLYAINNGPTPELRVFNTITRRWLPAQSWPLSGTARAFFAVGTRMLTVGSSGDHGLTLLDTQYTRRAKGLHWIDYGLIVLFLGGLLGLALFHRRRFRSADSYFRGGKNIPWLAAGLSVVATGQSATSFISIPARSFATNLQFALVPLTNVFGAFIMSRYFVRFFVRLNITSGYEYLQVRFSPLVRTIGSINYLAYELARISLLILVPAVAVSAVAKVDLSAAILTMGFITTVYTSLGGLEGVVWADVVQISLKITAIIAAVILIFAQLEGGVGELFSTARTMGKLRMVDWSFDLTRDSLFAFVLFWLTDGLKSYVANQTIIQRYVSTRDESSAQRSIKASAIVGTLISWTFLLAGLGLFLFYYQNPQRFDLTVDKPDAVFPWFIVFELPPGVVGLLMTALIAAAFSSLYGALNSTSTVIVTDFYRRFTAAPTDQGALRLGKICTVVIGIIATGLSLTLAGLSTKSLVEQTLSVIGLFGGGLGGLFLLGMLTTRVSAASALAGFVMSALVQYYVSRHTSLHWLTYMFTGMGSCFAAGLLASLVWPERRKLDGLTVHTCA